MIMYFRSWYLNHLLTKRILLEETMAWLSTLGGAHSSLGEYFTHHVGHPVIYIMYVCVCVLACMYVCVHVSIWEYES